MTPLTVAATLKSIITGKDFELMSLIRLGPLTLEASVISSLRLLRGCVGVSASDVQPLKLKPWDAVLIGCCPDAAADSIGNQSFALRSSVDLTDRDNSPRCCPLSRQFETL
jgi:hypothetical protein